MGKIVHKNNWFCIEEYIHTSKGSSKTYVRLLHQRNGSMIIPVRRKKLVLERQYRYNIGRSFIEIPGGGVEKYEDFMTAANREVAEETGFTPVNMHYLFRTNLAPEFMGSSVYYFTCRLGKRTKRHLDITERIVTKEILMAKALSMIRKGKIDTNLTLIGVLYYATFLMPKHGPKCANHLSGLSSRQV